MIRRPQSRGFCSYASLTPYPCYPCDPLPLQLRTEDSWLPLN